MFEWDPAEAEANLAEHGIDFADAARLLAMQPLIVAGKDGPDGEKRYEAIGIYRGCWLTVVFARRSAVYRILSARPASRAERRKARALLDPGAPAE